MSEAYTRRPAANAGRTSASGRTPHQRPPVARQDRSDRRAEQQRQTSSHRQQATARRRRRRRIAWGAGGAVVVAVITLAMLSAQPTNATIHGKAPSFTMINTAGQSVNLSDFRGRTVLLYFSEGVGCDPCFQQTVDIEQHRAEFDRAGVTVLPIVMNPPGQVRQELSAFNIHTPYLIDSGGQVSAAYHVLGKGMHSGLPGHGFVLVDGHGNLRWYGEYPNMYVSSAALLQQVSSHLHT